MNEQKDVSKAGIKANENHAVLGKLSLTFCGLQKLAMVWTGAGRDLFWPGMVPI